MVSKELVKHTKMDSLFSRITTLIQQRNNGLENPINLWMIGKVNCFLTLLLILLLNRQRLAFITKVVVSKKLFFIRMRGSLLQITIVIVLLKCSCLVSPCFCS